MTAPDGRGLAIVTGAAGGIGRAVALALAADGHHIVAVDRGTPLDTSARADPTVVLSVTEEIRAVGGVAEGRAADVAAEEDVAELFTCGTVTRVVHCAGILRDRAVWNVPLAEWEDVLAVHLRSTFLLAKHFALHRKADPVTLPAHLVTFTSSAGIEGNFGSSSYGSAKAAVVGLSRVLAIELATLGVAVNCIAPAARTRMSQHATRARRDPEAMEILDALDPGDVARFVAALISIDDGSITGELFSVRGREVGVYAQPQLRSEVTVAAGRAISPADIQRLVQGV